MNYTAFYALYIACMRNMNIRIHECELYLEEIVCGLSLELEAIYNPLVRFFIYYINRRDKYFQGKK